VTGVTFDDSTAHFVSSAALLTVSFDGDETERFPTEYDALIEALAKSIVEISSSSLTTIAGLVALMLMQFRLGYDLGLVLSKSIVCSLITVFLLMPGLIAYCRKPLRVTAHRSHIPQLYGWGRFLMKTKLGFVAIFLVILPMAVCCSSRTEYAFSDSSIDELVHSESRGGALNELGYTRDGSRIVLLFLPQKLYFQAMRYEKYIMGVVLLLVFFGLLNIPLNLCVNAAWRLLLNLTGFVELLFGIA